MTEKDDYNLMLFHFAYQTFIKTADEIIEKYGMSRQHHRFLFYISKMPGISVKELLDFLEITKQGSHRTFSKLKTEQLIEEYQANDDKRIKRLYPTQKGKNLVQILNEEQNKLLTNVFEDAGYEWFNVMERLAHKREGFRTIQAKYQLGEEKDEF
ncbi:MarR family winged helix-turn-helix transcriptional regulator [Barrientosiimonas marina]|uniref:MarR family winged helix-turn-helix transcriptional regulator n=1 Tax=Lentibacillus kimchii TaxID=1542911 RepID=A0ABW2UUV3_9BACI